MLVSSFFPHSVHVFLEILLHTEHVYTWYGIILFHPLCHFWVHLCELIFLLFMGHITQCLWLSSDF